MPMLATLMVVPSKPRTVPDALANFGFAVAAEALTAVAASVAISATTRTSAVVR